MNYSGLTLCGAAVFCTATLVACGDKNTTEVTEQTGMSVVSKGEKLPDCTSENDGDMLYVTDSSAVYFCAEGKWSTLNGDDGKPGETPAAKDGVSCTAKKTEKDDIEVTCGDKVVATFKNGEPGESPIAKAGADCAVSDLGDGHVVVKCGTGDDAQTVTLSKAFCGTDAYDPETQFCVDGTAYRLCGSRTFDPKTQYCQTVGDAKNVKDYGFVVDKAGQKYKTVVIGDQVWMAENLNYNTNFKDENDVEVVNSWCLDELEKNCEKYGRLYTWAAAIDSVALARDEKNPQTCGNAAICDRLKEDALAENPIQGACPDGWHLPSSAEWNVLIETVGGKEVAGKMLKSTSEWAEGGNGVDAYGFAAYLVGYMGGYDGTSASFTMRASEVRFYSATADADRHSSGNADALKLIRQTDVGEVGSFPAFGGNLVRCLKDSEVKSEEDE